MPDQVKQMAFPVAGIAQERAVWDQKPRPLPQDQWDQAGQTTVVPGLGVEQQPVESSVYGRSTPRAVNVRSFSATKDRRSGGSRPGLSKLLSTIPCGSRFIVQHLTVVITSSSAARV